MAGKLKRISKKKKVIIIVTFIAVISVGIGFFFANYDPQPPIVKLYEYYMDGIETDEKYSKITRKEAEEIAIKEGPQKYDIDLNDYEFMDSSYWSNGTWHILFYNEEHAIDGGITLVVDENTKHLAILIP